jgi:hypothetical protein
VGSLKVTKQNKEKYSAVYISPYLYVEMQPIQSTQNSLEAYDRQNTSKVKVKILLDKMPVHNFMPKYTLHYFTKVIGGQSQNSGAPLCDMLIHGSN